MKILIIKLSSMGDVLHALPAAEEIARATGARIHWAVQPEFSGIVRAFGCVERVIEIPRPSKFREWLKAVRQLGSEKYDVVVDLQGLLKSAAVAVAAGGRRTFGPAYAREGAGWFYNGRPPKNGRKHAVEECMDVAELLCGNAGKSVPPSGECAAKFHGAKLLLPESPFARGDKMRVAIAPRSRWESKNWPAENFAELARRLAENGAEVCVIGGKNDNVVSSAETKNSIYDFCGKASLLESAALLKTCDCLVTNDSGPMHIAAALGVRCVALFGPTDAARTGPYGAGHVVLKGVCEKAPCYKRTCPKGDKSCLKGITVETVLGQCF